MLIIAQILISVSAIFSTVAAYRSHMDLLETYDKDNDID